MSSASSKRRGPSSRPKQRRPSGQRPSKIREQGEAGIGQDEAALPTAAAAPRTASRSRRTPAVAHVMALPREVEFAYIRNDLRRLVAIAGGLLVLMLVILFVANR